MASLTNVCIFLCVSVHTVCDCIRRMYGGQGCGMKPALGMQLIDTHSGLTAPKITRADAYREAGPVGVDFLMLRACICVYMCE